jgi:predicted PhzF superfamily epimerase YddE/YHI9
VAHSWCANGPSWMGLLLPSADHVLSIRPDYGLLGHMDVGVIGPIGKDDDDGFDFEVRAFMSLDEGGEDPVCGSLNASLAQWLIGSGRAPASGYVVRQGTALGRKGRVSASVDSSSASSSSSSVLWIGGMCITCIKGEVQI